LLHLIDNGVEVDLKSVSMKQARKFVGIAADSLWQWRVRPGFVRRHPGKLLALFLWLTFLLLYSISAWQSGLTLRQSVYGLAAWMTRNWYGVAFYTLLFALRPLLFIPATPMTLLSGFLFGPAVGLFCAVLGLNTSAMFAYATGRYLGSGVLNENLNGHVGRYTAAMRRHSFESVLVMRLLLLPYDLVNYAAGLLRIKWELFLLATIIGSVPGTVSFVLLGASFGTLDELLAGEVKLNATALAVSAVLIVASLAVSHHLRRRESGRLPPPR
jgi:uncharacterized membrane protein YdjX (TVP38/TMEM64 family)